MAREGTAGTLEPGPGTKTKGALKLTPDMLPTRRFHNTAGMKKE